MDGGLGGHRGLADRPAHRRPQDLLRAGAARLRPGGCPPGSLSYPERALVRHRHPRHRRAGAGLAVAGGPRPALGARGRHRLVLLVGLTRMWLGRPLPLRRRRRLGARRGLEPCSRRCSSGRSPRAGRRCGRVVSGFDQRIVLAPTDGSLGPLLRIADDRLPPGAGYGRHEHRDVDVVAVVLAGSLRHSWGYGAEVAAGDVARPPGRLGLNHDEIAGDDGARVLQCYLRGAEPRCAAVARGAPRRGGLGGPAPSGCPAVAGPAPAGGGVEVPPGLLVLRGVDGVLVEQQAGRVVRGPGQVLVWQLDTARPARTRGGGLTRGGRGESGACRSAPPSCSPPPTTTPTAPSTCAAGCTGTPRSACTCRGRRRWCWTRSPTCRSR